MPHRFPPLAPQPEFAARPLPRLPWAGLAAVLLVLVVLRLV